VPAPTNLTPRAIEDNDFSRAWGPGDFPAPAQLVNCRVKCHQDVPRHIWGFFQALGIQYCACCKAKKKSVIGAHNRCWKYLIVAISTHVEPTRDLEFIGGDKDKQLEKLWAETMIGNILQWDEIADEEERLLEGDQANRQVPSQLDPQSFVRPRVQAHIRSRAKLPRKGGISGTGSARRPRQKSRKGGRRSSWRE
jgi:hypothetical protein